MPYPDFTPAEQKVLAVAEQALHTESESINGADLLERITRFIGRYLQCAEHQRTVLALWVLHTHCSSAAQVSPYLSIQSVQKQSGKTLCLQLLNLLCDSPALTAGFTTNTLTRRIDGPISTILLDECQATVGTRARSKGPTLRAILASGFHCGIGYTDAIHERNAFSPKAFAGMGQLPEALADRSISIILEPLKGRVAQAPSPVAFAVEKSVAENGAKVPSAAHQKVQRFDLRCAIKDAQPLQEQLHAWAEENDFELEERPVYSEEDFPPNLSPRRCDIIEPLLQLADYVGGVWPARIREALAIIFEAETAFELRHSLQLLADIRDCFARHNYPERLSTSTLLAWMQALPTRPWDVDGPISPRTFARLLLAFDIHPRVQRIGPSDPARGYQLKDFLEPWQTHLHCSVPTQGFESVTHSHESEITNGHAPCNAVTDSHAISAPAANELPRALVSAEGWKLPVTDNSQSEIAAENAGCNGVTDSGAIPVPCADFIPQNGVSHHSAGVL